MGRPVESTLDCAHKFRLWVENGFGKHWGVPLGLGSHGVAVEGWVFGFHNTLVHFFQSDSREAGLWIAENIAEKYARPPEFCHSPFMIRWRAEVFWGLGNARLSGFQKLGLGVALRWVVWLVLGLAAQHSLRILRFQIWLLRNINPIRKFR